MTGRTDDQEVRVRAQQLFRAYLGVLSMIHAGNCGWARVADALDDAAAEARSHVPQEPRQ